MKSVGKELFESAVVLCGGASKRMGFDKSLIPSARSSNWLLDDIIENLLQVFPHVMAIGDCGYTRGEWRSATVDLALKNESVVFIGDRHQGKGPISGLLEAMLQSRSTYVYLTACDMPNIEPGYIKRLKERVVTHGEPKVVLGVLDGKPEPFQAFYRCDLSGDGQNLLNRNQLSLMRLIEQAEEEAFLEIELGHPDEIVFFNMNDRKTLNLYSTKGEPSNFTRER